MTDQHRADAVFAALADPTRRRILGSVVDDGPLSATNLAGRFPITRQAVHKHLAVLRDAKLVQAERVGRETHWSASLEPLADVDAWIDAVGDRWNDRLRRLDRVVKARRQT